MNWWEIEYEGTDPEENVAILFEHGVAGSELLGPNRVKVFFKGTQAELASANEIAKQVGLVLINQRPVKNENWVQKCSEVWEPVVVGEVRLLPQIGEQQPLQAQVRGGTKDLRIIPGFGFGTGHHESTRLALSLMQSEPLLKSSTVNVLDVGTGNGVLSLAARALFKASVAAIDNDEAALINASENLELNSHLAPISFSCGVLNSEFGEYDLILANIYAEVLCAYKQQFFDHLRPNGYLIMAGVNLDTVQEIYEKFSKEEWEYCQEQQENRWIGLLLRKLEV